MACYHLDAQKRPPIAMPGRPTFEEAVKDAEAVVNHILDGGAPPKLWTPHAASLRIRHAGVAPIGADRMRWSGEPSTRASASRASHFPAISRNNVIVGWSVESLARRRQHAACLISLSVSTGASEDRRVAVCVGLTRGRRRRRKLPSGCRVGHLGPVRRAGTRHAGARPFRAGPYSPLLRDRRHSVTSQRDSRGQGPNRAYDECPIPDIYLPHPPASQPRRSLAHRDLDTQQRPADHDARPRNVGGSRQRCRGCRQSHSGRRGAAQAVGFP
jgi:hypothetical protein